MAYLDENGLARFKSKLDDQLDERIEEQSEETSVLLTGKLNIPANVPQGKFLQTNENGEAVWGDGASSATITTAVNNWLADNVAGGSTIAVDTSLNVTGAAAESKTVGTKLNNQILVQDSQPSSADNKIWVKETPQTEIQVPTYTEFTDLKSALDDLNVVSIAKIIYLGQISFSTNKWASIGNATYNYAIIPVNGGESIRIVSNGTRSSIFAALTNYSAPTTGDTPSFSAAEGWTESKSVGTTSSVGTFVGTLPADARYLYVYTKKYTPSVVSINGYDYATSLVGNLQGIISNESEIAAGLGNVSSIVIKCDRTINTSSLLVAPYDDLNTLPQGSIVTYIGQIPAHVPANVTSTTDTVLTIITYNYKNSAILEGGAVQLITGSSGNAWIRMKYTNSKWTTFKCITKSGDDIIVPALSTFDHIGIIGDSWSSGSAYTAQGVYDHYPKLRWGYIASKLYGFTPAFFTSPGASTKTWLTREAGLPAMQAADAQDLYVCCLGINDHARSYTIGNTTDMDDDSADSFYGSYGKIIRAIKVKAQYAKIAVALIPEYNAEADVSSYNTAIRNVADHFSIGLLDTDIDPFFNSDLFKNDRQWNHLTAVGYTGMARAINAMLSKDYAVNHTYWKYSMIDV